MMPKVFLAIEAEYWLSAFGADMENASFEPAFRACVPELMTAFGDNFEQAHGPDGAWAPHAPYTIKLYGVHPLLILSGELVRSVTGEKNPGGVLYAESREMTIGTTIFYAAWQNYGTTKIPARPFMWLDEQNTDIVASKFLDGVYVILLGAN